MFVLALWPTAAGAQALPGFSSLRVAYNTRKATAKPDGELKAQIDAVDREIAAAVRSGDMGEARRQLARGMALLSRDAVDAGARLPELAGHQDRAHGDRLVRARTPPGWSRSTSPPSSCRPPSRRACP